MNPTSKLGIFILKLLASTYILKE